MSAAAALQMLCQECSAGSGARRHAGRAYVQRSVRPPPSGLLLPHQGSTCVAGSSAPPLAKAAGHACLPLTRRPRSSYPNQCYTPPVAPGPNASALFGQCMFSATDEGSIALANELVAAAQEATYLPRPDGVTVGEEEYWTVMQNGGRAGGGEGKRSLVAGLAMRVPPAAAVQPQHVVPALCTLCPPPLPSQLVPAHTLLPRRTHTCQVS